MNSWPDDDPEVQEVIAENGGRFRYRGGRWYGGVNPRTGHWDLRVSADPGDALRLSQRVMEKKMERQRREMEEQMREGQEAAGEAAAGAGAGAAPRARRPSLGQWGMGVATAFGGHVASMVAAGAVALTPIIAEAVNVAAQPLGGTGQASAQVGMSLLQFLANSLRSVSRIGGMVVGAALYSVLGPAFGIAFGFLTAELGSLLGNFGQALGQALRGVRGVFEDINRVGQETADVIMRIANNAGMAAEAATRLTMSMQAAGVPLQTIGGLFGHWGARREFLEPRLAVLGIGYEQFQRAPMLTLHDALQGFPDLVRLPMLRTVFGPQAEALYPRIMRPREELVEAQRLVERWAGSPEAFARMQRHVEAMEERVGFLGRMLRVHLLEGFLPVMEAGLQTLLRLWDQNREAIIRFATQTAPREFLNLVTRAVDWLRQHWPEIVQGARDLRDILSDVWNFVRWIADKLREIRDLWPFGHAPAGGGSPPGGGAPGGSGSPTAMGMMPAGAPVQGPLGQIWEGAKTLTWLSAASLGLRYLPRLFGLGAQAAGPGAITEAPLARPLLSLLTGMGRGELLYEAPLLLKAGPAVAGTAGWLATVPGLMEWYASGLQGRQQKDWAFLATMLGSAALGWRPGYLYVLQRMDPNIQFRSELSSHSLLPGLSPVAADVQMLLVAHGRYQVQFPLLPPQHVELTAEAGKGDKLDGTVPIYSADQRRYDCRLCDNRAALVCIPCQVAHQQAHRSAAVLDQAVEPAAVAADCRAQQGAVVGYLHRVAPPVQVALDVVLCQPQRAVGFTQQKQAEAAGLRPQQQAVLQRCFQATLDNCRPLDCRETGVLRLQPYGRRRTGAPYHHAVVLGLSRYPHAVLGDVKPGPAGALADLCLYRRQRCFQGVSADVVEIYAEGRTVCEVQTVNRAEPVELQPDAAVGVVAPTGRVHNPLLRTNRRRGQADYLVDHLPGSRVFVGALMSRLVAVHPALRNMHHAIRQTVKGHPLPRSVGRSDVRFARVRPGTGDILQVSLGPVGRQRFRQHRPGQFRAADGGQYRAFFGPPGVELCPGYAQAHNIQRRAYRLLKDRAAARAFDMHGPAHQKPLVTQANTGDRNELHYAILVTKACTGQVSDVTCTV